MPSNPEERSLKSLTPVVRLYRQFSTISVGLRCHAHKPFTVMMHIAHDNAKSCMESVSRTPGAQVLLLIVLSCRSGYSYGRK